MPREILTLNTKLYVNRGNGDENLIDLLSTPDLGVGDAEKIEVTNLQDGTRRYINGIKDVGDSLEFEFNYTTDTYDILKEIEDSKQIYTYKVVLPGENNVEDGLCFSFKAALSVKVTGAAVGEQIKMTINLTPYSAISVGEYEEGGNEPSQQNEYSTFRIGAIPQTFNMRSGETTGTMNLYYNEEEPIYEVYINNEPQELPTGKIQDWDNNTVTTYEVKEGDIIKIRGGFSLSRTEVPLEDIVIQDGLKDCEGMFSECLGLTVAPRIPNGVENCEYMFDSCENITEAVEIPNGVINCEGMYDYTSITVAPTIPSTVINCNSMFAGCSGLTKAPVIPNSVTDCGNMFDSCANLTEAPVIPSTVTDCSYMFYDCTSLEEAPVIPSTVTDCSYMFYGCTSLSVIPQENIDLMNNPPEGLIFENCFKNCPLVVDQIPVAWGGNKVEEPEETTYTVTYLGQTNYDGEVYTYSNKATTVNAGDSFTTTLTAMYPSDYGEGGFMVPIIEEMEVWMDGIEITEECGVVRGTEVTITIKNVTGDISIDVLEIRMGMM